MNEDWNALMDSEVMRNYLQQELSKEAQPEPQISEEKVVSEFAAFENQINENEEMKQAFLLLQKKLGSDQEYAQACDPLFVQAVMMLDLDED